MKIQALSLALALAVGGIGHALAVETIDTTQRVDQIVLQQNEIRQDVKASRNGWEALPEAKRGEVLHQQDRLFELLQGKETIGDLGLDQQVEAANLLASIKATVTGAEDERMICTRERKMGSNFTQRVCRTVGQIRREREATRMGLERGDQRQRMQPKSLNGSL